MNLIANRRPITVSRLLAPLKRILTRLGAGPGHEIRLRSNYRLGDIKVRVSFDRAPIEITLGQDDKKLHLYPETRIDERGKVNRTGNFVIVDPAAKPRRHGDGRKQREAAEQVEQRWATGAASRSSGVPPRRIG